MGERLKGTHTFGEMVKVMSEGNQGALTYIMEMVRGGNWAQVALTLDSIGLYGDKIYILWNDCCDRDVRKVEKVLSAWREGKLTTEDIHKNLDQGWGVPFEGLE